MANNPTKPEGNESQGSQPSSGDGQVSGAEEQAKKVLADAQAEAEKVLADAKAEAEKVKEDADKAAEKTKVDAKKAAGKKAKEASSSDEDDLGPDTDVTLQNRLSTNSRIYGPGKVTVPKVVAEDLLRRDAEQTNYQLDLHRERNYVRDAETARKNGNTSNETTI